MAKTVKRGMSLVVKSVTRFNHTDQVHLESDDGCVKITIDQDDTSSFHVGQTVNITIEQKL